MQNMFMVIFLCLGLIIFPGCPDDTDTSDSDTIDGDIADGDAADGDATDGDIADGDAADGDATDGDITDGDADDGDATDGDITDGDAADGDDTDGDITDGDAADGDGTDGDITDGDAADGDGTDGDITDGDADDGDATDGDEEIDDIEDPQPDGDSDFERLETPEECIVDQYGENFSWETAYEVPWSSGTLRNIVWCPGMGGRFFKVRFTPGMYINFRAIGDGASDMLSHLYEYSDGPDEREIFPLWPQGGVPHLFRAEHDGYYMLELFHNNLSTIKVNDYHILETDTRVPVESNLCENARVFDGSGFDWIGGIGPAISNLMTNNYSGSCAGADSNELVIKLEGLNPEIPRYLMIDADFFINIHIRTVCEDPETEIYCQDLGEMGAGVGMRFPETDAYVFIESDEPFGYGSLHFYLWYADDGGGLRLVSE